MTSAEGVALTRESRSVLVGIADPQLAKRFLAVLQRSVEPGAVFIAGTLPHLFEHLKSSSSRVVVFADDLAEGLPLTEVLRQILEVVPVIVLAPQERQTEIATLVAARQYRFRGSGRRLLTPGCRPRRTTMALVRRDGSGHTIPAGRNISGCCRNLSPRDQ